MQNLQKVKTFQSSPAEAGVAKRTITFSLTTAFQSSPAEAGTAIGCREAFTALHRLLFQSSPA